MHANRATRTVAATAAVVLLALVAACGGSGGEASSSGGSSTTAPTTATTTTTTAPARLGTGDGTFTRTTVTYADPTRSTGPTPGRSIPTDVYVPGGRGPFPLVVQNHGLGGSSAKFTKLLGDWAAAGYLVVAPNFPLTNADLPEDRRDVNDVVNQPADVRFVLDRVLAEDAPGGRLEGKIAADHMGVSGLSLGGATTYALAFHSCCREHRFRSAILMSALQLDFPGAYDWTRRLPVLVFAGTGDRTVHYDAQQTYISKLPGPTWSVTLDGGQPSAPFEDPPSPHDAVVTATTLDFWAATLRDDATARARLAGDATVPGVASVVVTP